MKQCPECHQFYHDDLNYCLLDGKVLRSVGGGPVYDDEATVVEADKTHPYPNPPGPTPSSQDPPRPNPPYPTPPSPAVTPAAVTPAASPPQRSLAWRVFSAIGIAVAILLYVTWKIAVWSNDHPETATATNDNRDPSFSANSNDNSAGKIFGY